MADNRSLDEFVGADEPSEPDGAADAADTVEPTAGGTEPDAEGTDARDTPPESEDPIEPMAETFAWSAAGGECGACGARVEERWRDGDALVCGACKAW